MKLFYLLAGCIALVVVMGMFAVGFQGLADTQTENSTIWNETNDAQGVLTGFAEDTSAFIWIIASIFGLAFLWLMAKVLRGLV